MSASVAIDAQRHGSRDNARMEIWINPACSKCRSALSILDAEGADYTVRRYLEDVPTPAEISGKATVFAPSDSATRREFA